MKLPHELHPWISPDGVVSPGTHELDAPLFVPRAYVLRGSDRPTTLRFRDKQANGIELEGGIAGLTVLGGRIGVNVRDGAHSPFAIDVMVTDAGLIPLWVGRCIRARIERVLVVDAPDNGVQLESPMDCTMHSCAVVGLFGNKAIDMSHGTPTGTRLTHLTVVALRGYGVGLLGWKPEGNNALLNSAIFAPAPGPGASGFGVHLQHGPGVGRFDSNVVQGGVPGSMDVTPEQFDLTGSLTTDLPAWTKPLSLFDQLRPASNRRMWGASLRTSLSRDLSGAIRVPWRGRLAVGAMARSTS